MKEIEAFKVVVEGKLGFKAFSTNPFQLRVVVRKEKAIGNHVKIERCKIWGAYMPEQMKLDKIVYKPLSVVF